MKNDCENYYFLTELHNAVMLGGFSEQDADKIVRIFLEAWLKVFSEKDKYNASEMNLTET